MVKVETKSRLVGFSFFWIRAAARPTSEKYTNKFKIAETTKNMPNTWGASNIVRIKVATKVKAWIKKVRKVKVTTPAMARFLISSISSSFVESAIYTLLIKVKLKWKTG